MGLSVAIAGAVILFASAPAISPRPMPPPLQDPVLLDEGRYLAAAGDCVACHTRPGGEPFAGGRPLDTPFGVIYSGNITPDPDTGIGVWTEAEFARAIREGIAADGSHLYPALPYTAYTRLEDADVHALYAYVRSLKPVRYTPPANALPFPFNVRSLVGGWNALYFTPGRYRPDPTRSLEWNRGAYLTQGLGHCGACHTPRNRLGAERSAQALAGGEYLDEIADEIVDGRVVPLDERTVRPWAAANLTSARSGLAAWSAADITRYLKTGHSARAAAFGPMSEVVANSTSRLTEADDRAIAVYLKSLPPDPAVPDTPQPAAATLHLGEIVFNARCGDCHLPSGLGIPQGPGTDASKTAPPLAGSAALQAPSPATLIDVILYGAHERPGADAGAWPYMSGFELSVGLDDTQIAALATYVRASWGNQAGPVDRDAVARQH
jgi:mono/diheme cytochrome c family protein